MSSSNQGTIQVVGNIVQNSALIACSTCAAQISPNSITCVQCGAPNNWVHPSVADFILNVNNISTSKQYYWSSKGTTFNAWTKPLNLSTIFYWIGAGFFGLFFLGLIGAASDIMSSRLVLIFPTSILVPLGLAVISGIYIGIASISIGVLLSLFFDISIINSNVLTIDLSSRPPRIECDDEILWDPLKKFFINHKSNLV